MSTRAGLHTATVVAREQVSPHLVRLRLSGAGMGGFTASNPCSEYMSLDNSSCNLASLNLMKFLQDDDAFDAELFSKAV
ncbi:hypothetical protein, partial [Streptomyces rhizosphaericus]|uniref:hypothetical protein n=1 Tax=Streptomyces rhizosphaericus TaxID=114699 RepID=UPI0031D0B1CF